MGQSLNRRWFNVASAPGTGNIAVSTALTGYLGLGAAQNGMTFDGVTFLDGSAWEVRNGCTYTHGTTTLSRGTLEESSTGGATTLSSATTVMLSVSASTMSMLDVSMQSVIPGGRLTTESGVPVSTSDRTSQSTIYYTPFVHDTVPLWDGAQWRPVKFTEKSLSLSGLTSGRPYDVFGYLSSGQLVLEFLAWTNDTTRATAVTLQDGRYCKSGDKTRLLLGTFYTTATTTTEDSEAKRYVSNVYNAVSRRILSAISATYSHAYTSAAWREWNGGTGVVRPAFVNALPLGSAGFGLVANLSAAAAQPQGILNIQLDGSDGSVRLSSTNLLLHGTNVVLTVYGPSPYIAAGRHSVAIVEYGNAGTTYYSADVSGDVPC